MLVELPDFKIGEIRKMSPEFEAYLRSTRPDKWIEDTVRDWALFKVTDVYFSIEYKTFTVGIDSLVNIGLGGGYAPNIIATCEVVTN